MYADKYERLNEAYKNVSDAIQLLNYAGSRQDPEIVLLVIKLVGIQSSLLHEISLQQI